MTYHHQKNAHTTAHASPINSRLRILCYPMFYPRLKMQELSEIAIMPVSTNPPTILALATEIRFEIYGYLFIQPIFNLHRKPNSPALCSSTSHNFPTNAQIHRTEIPTALLRTCRQIQGEACAALYSHNTFGFNDPKVLLAFLVQIGQTNTHHIRALHIVIPWNQEQWAFWPVDLLCKLSSDATNLRNTDITFERVPKNKFHKYGFESQDDIVSLVAGRRICIEFNLSLALSRLPGLERVAVWGHCGDGWLDCLKKRIGCKVLSRRTINDIEGGWQLESQRKLYGLGYKHGSDQSRLISVL
jgi:hypothetical protein